jgi:hypothetical protein
MLSQSISPAYLIFVYLTTLSIALIIHRRIRQCLAYNEVERMWTVLAQTEVLSDNLVGGLRKAPQNLS